MTDSVDPKEYQHLLYENRKFKGRVVNHGFSSTYYFYVFKDKSSEEQQRGGSKSYHVALLDTGELVCVHCGYMYQTSVMGGTVYIGMGVVHHDEYW